MKKFFAILLMTLLMASALCVAAFAADPVVIRISGLKADGTLYSPENCTYTSFETGWEAAVDYAKNSRQMKKDGVVRVAVDLYADWNANDDGEFGDNGNDGFRYGAILVPDDTRMMINMNGHTIDRGLKTDEYDGKVICVNDGADLIINGGLPDDTAVMSGEETSFTKMGIITGGNNRNGAGGIHMRDGSTVTLNNVILSKNRVADDKGAAIAMYNGATLIMNGGGFLDNYLAANTGNAKSAEGTLFVDDSTAVLNKVLFRGNDCTSTDRAEICGVAVSMNGDSEVTLDGCKVESNALAQSPKMSVFYCDDNSCTLNLNHTVVRKNGSYMSYGTTANAPRRSALFNSWGTVNINSGQISNNAIGTLFLFINTRNGAINVRGAEIRNNSRLLQVMDQTEFWQKDMGNNVINLSGCTVSDFTDAVDGDPAGFVKVNFINCRFGNIRWGNGKRTCSFISTTNSAASILGDGSPAMIVSLTSLVASITAIVVCIALYKKKETHAAAKKSEDEE